MLCAAIAGCRCIYNYDAAHPVGGAAFKEEDEPNYVGSFYSLTKGFVDKLSPNYKHALTLRLRMPISDDLNGRNFGVCGIAPFCRVLEVARFSMVAYCDDVRLLLRCCPCSDED